MLHHRRPLKISTVQFLLSLLLLPALLSPPTTHRVNSLPLSTRGRWIVDSPTGRRVKLRCVNWAAHMPAVVAEGLDRQPLDSIAARIAALGFNCVRLTWATHTFTRPGQYANLTVAGSLVGLGLGEAAKGVAEKNPGMVGMTVAEAYEEVVGKLGEAGLMVALDNHVSRPQWCCGADDGNGFFGDFYFDADEWLAGLDAVARRFRNYPQVVAMSMRNELRGPNQNEPAWYEHVTRGANAIHSANPDLLVIVSGLNYDTDLSFLAARPLAAASRHLLDGKLVLEAHWYAFSEGRSLDWEDSPAGPVCFGVARRFDRRAGFVARAGVPLFVSEFGVDQRGANRADNRFLSCFLAFATETDVDWAMWALQGSYYWRDGRPGFEETYGVLDSDWDRPKNPQFQERFRLIQQMIQDPSSQIPTYQIIYHPLSGQCVWADQANNNSILLSDCQNRTRWSYNGDGNPVMLAGTSLCLRVAADGIPATLSAECSDGQSTWATPPPSDSGFQIAAVDAQGRRLCLHKRSNGDPTVFTGECLCVEGSDCSENPQTQWFRFVSSNVE